MTVARENDTTPLRLWRTGDELEHGHLNEAVEAIEVIRRGMRPGRQVVNVKPAGGGASVRTVKLAAVGSDVLSVVFADAPTGDSFDVAMPYKLRKRPFDGKTIGDLQYVYRPRATNGDEIIVSRRVTMPGFPAFIGIEEIRPAYRLGDELQIASVNGTDLDFGSAANEPTSYDKLEWIDLNVDGRAWAIRGFARP